MKTLLKHEILNLSLGNRSTDILSRLQRRTIDIDDEELYFLMRPVQVESSKNHVKAKYAIKLKIEMIEA